MNALEASLLDMIDFKLHVDESTLADYQKTLSSITGLTEEQSSAKKGIKRVESNNSVSTCSSD